MLMAQSLGQARRNSVTSFQNYSIVILIILTIILTRPYAALRAAGLDLIVRLHYSLG